MALTRRNLLRGASAIGLGSMLGPLTFSNPANASGAAAAALAVAAFVAGRIAAHNRRDTSMIMQRALRAQLIVNAAQLSSLQTGVAAVLDKLAALSGEIETMLVQQSARQMQSEVKAAVTQFDNLRESRKQYDSEDSWLAAAHRESELKDVLFKLRNGRALIDQSASPWEPTSALIVASAALTELNLMNLLGHNPREILTAIDRYTAYFGRVNNATIPDSAKWYVGQQEKNKAFHETGLKTLPGGASLFSGRKLVLPGGAPAILGDVVSCAGINEHKPAHVTHTYWVLDKSTTPATQRLVVATAPDFFSPYQYLSKRAYVQSIAAENDPEVKTKLEEAARLMNTQIEAGETALTLLKFTAAEGDEATTKPPGSGSVFSPGSVQCGLMTVGEVAGARAKLVEKLRPAPEWAAALKRVAALEKKVDEINLAAAKLAYGKQALKASESTIGTLKRLRESYS